MWHMMRGVKPRAGACIQVPRTLHAHVAPLMLAGNSYRIALMVVREVLRLSCSPSEHVSFLEEVFASSTSAPVRLFKMILQDIAECRDRDGWKHALEAATPVRGLVLGRKQQLAGDEEFGHILKVAVGAAPMQKQIH